MVGFSHDSSVMNKLCERIHNGEFKAHIQAETGISTTTLVKYYRAWCKKNGKEEKHSIFNRIAPVTPCTQGVQHNATAAENHIINDTISPPCTIPRILIYDIETLPNLGYFWDTYSDRAIPLDFIIKPKSICTIAWKWYDKPECYVLVVDAPYDDKAILEAFLLEWSKADYVVAHYSRFDKPFIAARLMANGLPSLPPVNDICTYKLAKGHFGRSLNGNKLDHLGTILGVGRKIKTHADLWVGCASGDKEALRSMAEYNLQDVQLLNDVFRAMLPHVKSKLNFNLHTDEPVMRCKQCGSDHLEPMGFEYTAATMRHRYLCKSCGSYSTFPPKAVV